MSGKEQASGGWDGRASREGDHGLLDRRARKTKEALLGAFAELFFQRRYDEIRVGDIVEGADVGRSTFYAHYRDKDELLVRSMSGFFDVLADATREEEEGPRAAISSALEMVMDHFWQNRDAGRHLLAGPPARHVLPQLTRELAQRIEQRLESRLRERGGKPLLPLHLIAIQVAEAQVALIKAWLKGEAWCTPAELAIGLRRSTLGALAALFCTAE